MVTTGSAAAGAKARYDAFISYSHAADGRLAPALQSGLQRLAKPWFALPVLRVFRDQTSLSATPGLWSEITRQLAQARHFILMASATAAASHWVGEEVRWWLANRSPQQILIVATDGEIHWDADAGDFDWSRTTCLPRDLAGRFAEEPLWVDLRWARDRNDLSLRHARFRAAVLDLAAPLHGRPKDQLDSEDIRQHRRLRIAGYGASAAIGVLAVAFAIAAWVAQRNERLALQAARTAEARAVSAQALLAVREGRLAEGAGLALRAHAIDDTPESRAALFQAVQAGWDYRGVLSASRAAPVRALAFDAGGAPIAFVEGVGVQRWDKAARGRPGAPWLPEGPPATAVAFGGAGRLLALGDADGTLRVWELPSRRLLGTQPLSPGAAITALAFDPAARRLAVGSFDARVQIWDVAAGRLLPVTLQEEPGLSQDALVAGLAWDADGNHLAVANPNPSALVGIWSIPAGRLVGRMSPSNSFWVNQAVVLLSAGGAGDGGLLAAVGTSDGTVQFARQASAPDWSGVQTAQPHEAVVLALATDGGSTASGGGDGRVALFASPQQAPVVPAGWSRAALRSLAFSPDGNLLAAGNEAGEVVLLDARMGRPRTLLSLAGPDAGAPVIERFESPDGRLVAAFGPDALTLSEAASAPRRLARIALPPPSGERRTLRWSPDSRWLLTDAPGGLALWPTDGREAPRPAAPLREARFSPDGAWLGCRGADGRALLWHLAEGREAWRSAGAVAGHWLFDRSGAAAALREDDGRTTVLGLSGAHGVEKAVLRPADPPVALAGGGRWLLTVAGDRTTSALDLDAPAAAPQPLPGVLFGASLQGEPIGPDAAHLLLADRADLLVWPLGGARPVARLAGHGKVIAAAAFSPDRRLLASIDRGGAVIVWDATTWRRLSEPLAGEGEGEDDQPSVSFTRDGLWLDTPSARLPMHPDAWIAELCGRLLPAGTAACAPRPATR